MATALKDIPMVRKRWPKRYTLQQAIYHLDEVQAEKCKRSLAYLTRTFWEVISEEPLVWNWHMDVICEALEKLARQVALRLPKENDLIINIPPGTTKSILCSVMFQVWCWINWPWMRFICASYGDKLALEQAEFCRDIIRSEKFRKLFPRLEIKQDKDQKSNFRIIETVPDKQDPTKTIKRIGGNRFSTSVGGASTGMHAHIITIDDPINPKQAFSKANLVTANNWMDHTISTRKVNKAVTPTVLIMQRLHDDDPTGHMLKKKKANVKHICLPGEIYNYRKMVKPVELILKYKEGLLDPVRMSRAVLEEMESDLGQYGYAGQVGQNPSPPTGGMFQVDHFQIVDSAPSRVSIVQTIRYWDKAATGEKKAGMLKQAQGARTAGVKMSLLTNGKFLVQDCKAGRWKTHEREDIIKETTEADGDDVRVEVEQEPGSGGKDSAIATITNLAGFNVHADRPVGDKIYRADPYSVQVNHGNVLLLRAPWNDVFIEDHRSFPFGTTKDTVDAASGAFNKLTGRRLAGPVLKSRGKR